MLIFLSKINSLRLTINNTNKNTKNSTSNNPLSNIPTQKQIPNIRFSSKLYKKNSNSKKDNEVQQKSEKLPQQKPQKLPQHQSQQQKQKPQSRQQLQQQIKEQKKEQKPQEQIETHIISYDYQDIPLPKNLRETKKDFGFNQKYNSIDEFSIALNINCSKANCRFPSKCSPDKKACMCDYQYAEFHLETDTNYEKTKHCSYKRKSQNIYFILEFLLNCGVGHFYANNFLIAAVKGTIVLSCFLLTIFSLLFIYFSKGSIYNSKFSLGLFLACIATIWIIDTSFIGFGFYSDGNGVPLITWT